MAKMNREILVPYLQDICALHLTKKKYQDRIAALRSKMKRIRTDAVLEQPATKYAPDDSVFSAISGCAIPLICIGAIPLIPVIMTIPFGIDISGWLSDLGLKLVIIGAITAGVCYVLHLIWKSSQNAKIDRENQRNIQNWQQQSNLRKADAETRCTQISNEIRSVEHQIDVINGLLTRAYSANLIPSRYRDLYAAVYLYDWFSTGMSDDMDMALNTYVLEQIKSRLDTIIRNQAEQIINQRAILANQAQTMNMIERNAQEMRKNVSRMNDSMEKQNMYLKMIDSNVAATRYFAEVTYRKWN